MLKRVLFIASMCAVCLHAFAVSPTEQRLDAQKNSQHLIYIGDEPAVDTVAVSQMMTNFYIDQFRSSQDPLAPYFMFMSKSGNLAMGIGGVVRMRVWYDWNGAMDNSAFVPYMIPIPNNPTREHWYGSTPSGTAIFARVFGHSDKVGLYQAYIEAKFSGYGNRDFKLSKAYFAVGDWTVGYAPSTYTDPMAAPPTVDGQGPNAIINHTNVLVRWTHTFRNGIVAAASIESPNGGIPALEGKYTGCSDFMPDVAAFLQYQWNGGLQHVRLSGIVRGLEYRDLVEAGNRKVMGWGVHLSTVFRPVDPLTVYGGINYGKGVGNMVQDLRNAPMDLLGDADNPGKMYAPSSMGWYAALQYHFAPNVFSTLVFSEVRFLPKHDPVEGSYTYKYGLYGAANVFWEIHPRCQIGLEYNIGKRMDINRQNKSADRVSLMGQFSF